MDRPLTDEELLQRLTPHYPGQSLMVSADPRAYVGYWQRKSGGEFFSMLAARSENFSSSRSEHFIHVHGDEVEVFCKALGSRIQPMMFFSDIAVG
jgi:hypothetical protein